MKILIPSHRREKGVAVIVMLAILAILLIYIAANVRSLDTLGREMQLVEQKQIRRLSVHAGSTNNPTAVAPESLQQPVSP